MLRKNAVLHKSFKPAKCKTALKMASSRIKLLKNKKEAQLKQLKREVAQLLQAGQDQTARIRVEHVVREEKTMAAYELIEIYCELIVTRLPMVESQKHCPIDLKEAISSVIFASPRCADIPELMDVRKNFAAKYGKEFVSAAVELRPDCGVSRLLVEKLSAKAPDGPTKIKILSTIAEEHNVKWDPKSFGEADIKPQEDLLNGPNTFEQASKMRVEPSHVQEPLNNIDKGYEKHDVPVNTYDPNSKASPYSQNLQSTSTGSNKAIPTGISHSDMRYQRTGAEGMEFTHPYAGGGSGSYSSTQSWNMEFKDATAAAQAAAESAERASMAARAAAELSSQGRITRQHSTESHKDSTFASRDERPENYAGRKLQGEHLAKDPTNNPLNGIKSGMHPEKSGDNEQDEMEGLMERFYNLKSSNQPSLSASSKSSSASVDDYQSVNDVQIVDRHSRMSSSERNDLFGEASVKGESSESDEEFVTKMQDGTKSQNVGYFEEASIRKHSTSALTHSHSQTFSDDHNVFSIFHPQQSGEGPVDDPLKSDKGKIERDTKETNSYVNATVVFDDSGSDDDEINFDVVEEHDDPKSGSYFSSEGGKSSSRQLANTNSWNYRNNIEESQGRSSSHSLFVPEQASTSVFSEGTAVFPDSVAPSQQDDLLSVTFDDSDGQSSDSEEELEKSKLVGNESTGIFPNKDTLYSRKSKPTHNDSPHLIESSFGDEENVGSNRKWFRPSSLDSDVEVSFERDQGNEVRGKNERNFDYVDMHTRQPSPRILKSLSNSEDFNDNLQTSELSSASDNVQINQSLDIIQDAESSFESGTELNFGVLTGGLRNKGYRHPPYRRNPSDNYSLSKRVAEDDPTGIAPSSFSPNVGSSSGVRDRDPYNQTHKKTSSGSPFTYSGPRDDNSDEDPPQPTFRGRQEPYNQEPGFEVNKKSSSGTYFDSDDSGSEENLPKRTLTRKNHSGSGFSRRTKAALTNSERNSYSKATVHSESSVNAGSIEEGKSSSRSYFATETQPKPESQIKASDYWGNSEQHISEPEDSKPILQSNASSHKESASRSYRAKTRPKLESEIKRSDYGPSSEQHRSEPQGSKPISQSNASSYKESAPRSSVKYPRQNPLAQSKSSDSWQSSEQPRSNKQAATTPIPESKSSSRVERLKSSAGKQPSNPPNTACAGSSQTSSSHVEPPSKETSISTASHVHPKLPDYDAFTAHLLSLRQNHQ